MAQRFAKPVSVVKRFRLVKRNPDGRVQEVKIGSTRYNSNRVRQVLGLTSTAFRWQAGREGITFTAIGYGHGVGMCQYGADGMGRQGWSYRQILSHYYQGISFARLNLK
jgi:stage II sporulation protein D